MRKMFVFMAVLGLLWSEATAQPIDADKLVRSIMSGKSVLVSVEMPEHLREAVLDCTEQIARLEYGNIQREQRDRTFQSTPQWVFWSSQGYNKSLTLSDKTLALKKGLSPSWGSVRDSSALYPLNLTLWRTVSFKDKYLGEFLLLRFFFEHARNGPRVSHSLATQQAVLVLSRIPHLYVRGGGVWEKKYWTLLWNNYYGSVRRDVKSLDFLSIRVIEGGVISTYTIVI